MAKTEVALCSSKQVKLENLLVLIRYVSLLSNSLFFFKNIFGHYKNIIGSIICGHRKDLFMDCISTSILKIYKFQNEGIDKKY